MPLEYMGFIPELYDVSKGFSNKRTIDKYAGIIVWLHASYEVKNYRDFFNWVIDRINEGNKVLFLEGFGFPIDKMYFDKLKLEILNNKSKLTDKVEIVDKKGIIGFESEPHIEYSNKLIKAMDSIPILTTKNSENQVFHPIAITEWGGYAIGNSFILNILDELLWIANPFDFLKEALQLDIFPVPDTTTENGNRILFTHIDGDGFSSKTEWDQNLFSSEALRDKIFKVYKIPHTVSVIEGELAPYGIYSKFSNELESIARTIFCLDNVAIASHSFSHPFKWNKVDTEQAKYSLSVKDYVFNADREIRGSIEYINKKLASNNKKVEVFFWTGDCLPMEDIIAKTYKEGIFNINGGYTTITNEFPWLSRISPMGIKRGEHYQVYAPVSNENFHTDLWATSFYGYVNVINTFKLTDKPRRLKPIDIYYHIYSGSKLASLNALDKVYKWALSEDILPTYAVEYIKKVLDFQDIAIAYSEEGWIIKSNGQLKTLRVSQNFGYPNLIKSKGVIGYLDYENDRFIHLDDSGDYYLVLNKEIPQEPFLIRTNAIVKKFVKDKENIQVTLFGYIPISFVLKNVEQYDVIINGNTKFKVENKDNKFYYSFDGSGEINVTIKHK
jgi:hypothetical protein